MDIFNLTDPSVETTNRTALEIGSETGHSTTNVHNVRLDTVKKQTAHINGMFSGKFTVVRITAKDIHGNTILINLFD